MKWHDYPPTFRGYQRLFEKVLVREKAPREIVKNIITVMQADNNLDQMVFQNTYAQIQAEADWIFDRRPYYNIWPSVIRPFTNVDLGKVKCSDIQLPLKRLMIRFPIEHELDGARSIFVVETVSMDKTARGLMCCINDGSTYPAPDMLYMPVHTINSMTFVEDQTIADRLQYGRDNPYCDDEINNKMVDSCLKLVCAICLLGDNPDLIEQVPIDADRVQWEKTHDIKLIEQADRRGKREWDVGRHIDVAPGYRNPHFAIRWMGRNQVEKKPVLRPVKGCLVRRRQIEDVPTGWLDDDEKANGTRSEG